MRYTSKNLISLILVVTIYLTAGPVASLAQLICQASGSPIVQTGAIGTGDLTQTGRTIRDGIPSSCAGKTNGLQNSTVVRRDAYNFTAPVTGCATVFMDMTGCGGTANNSTEVVAYSPYNPAAPGTGIIGDPGFSTIGTGSFSFPVTNGQAFTLVVHEITALGGCTAYSFTLSYGTACRHNGFDQSNDGKADPAVFRPSTGDWFVNNSAGGSYTARFGTNGDIPVAGDYNGDGLTNVAVYRPTDSIWYSGNVQANPGSNFAARKWGTTGDIPTPGDYDADGKSDLAIFRPSNGTWFVMQSSNNTLLTQPWGTNGDVPVLGDFDGDRKTDFGVFRPSDPNNGGNSRWYILESNFAYGFFLQFNWGLPTDKLVVADYDGDFKADPAVFRPSDGTWYVSRSSITASDPLLAFKWGQNGDIPQPADYDGDKKADFSVFRPSDGAFYTFRSSDSMFVASSIGTSGDQPVTTSYKVQ